MKICFLMRSEYESVHGGDVIQIENYKNQLETRGHSCTLSGSFLDEEFDVYIIVNIDRPIELYVYYLKIKKTNKPYYIVPIHHPIDAVSYYEQHIKGGLSGLFATVFRSFYTREKIKNLYRAFRGRSWYFKHIILTLPFNYISLTSQVIQESNGLFCISEQEADSIRARFTHDFTYCVLINAVAADKVCSSKNDLASLNDMYDVVVVGRIESRKNQVGIIRALKDSNLKVAIVGPLSELDGKYKDEFLKLVSSHNNISHLGALPHSSLFPLLRKCKVLINASYFEVSPLVDVEAAILGCRVVSTKNGYTKSNIEDVALVDPDDYEQIHAACISEISKWPTSHRINREVYSWSFAGDKMDNFILSTLK